MSAECDLDPEDWFRRRRSGYGAANEPSSVLQYAYAHRRLGGMLCNRSFLFRTRHPVRCQKCGANGYFSVGGQLPAGSTRVERWPHAAKKVCNDS